MTEIVKFVNTIIVENAVTSETIVSGVQGPPGATGPQGPAGTAGVAGAAGPQGTPGAVLVNLANSVAIPTGLTSGQALYNYGNGTASNYGDRLFIGIPSGNIVNSVLVGGKYYTDLLETATSSADSNVLVKRDSNGKLIGDILGNSATATKLSTARSISVIGDVVANAVNFDGTSNIQLNAALATQTGLTTGTYGSTTLIPVLTVNNKGVITAISTQTVASNNLLLTADNSTFGSVVTGSRLQILGGTGITTSASSNTVTINLNTNIATTSGTQTFTNKTISTNSTWAGNTISQSRGGTGSTTGSIITDSNLTFSSGSTLYLSAQTIDVGGSVLTNLTTPQQDSDAVTKAYADALKQGLDIKDSVKVATTTNINLFGQQSIDGISVLAGQRVLVKNQTNSEENGIWNVSYQDWYRSSDADTSDKVTAGLFTFVEQGTQNAGNGFVLTTSGSIILDTTALNFSQFSSGGTIIAGSGLTKTGNTISANFSGSYNDLSNKPTNLATETYVTTALSGKVNTSALAAVATSGSYTDLTNRFLGYDNEIHVSQVDGNDTTGNGDLLNPVATITKAMTLVSAQRRKVIVHSGGYTEDFTINLSYVTVTTEAQKGDDVVITGTVTANKGCTISGLKITNLTITAATGTGSVNILGCDITGTLTKSSAADYTLIRFCDIGTTNITGSGGLVAIFGGNPNFITINNAAARVIVKNAVTISPVLTAGNANFVDSIVLASTATSNAITSAAGTIVTLANSQFIVPTFNNVARVSLSGFYSIFNCVYDKPNSTLVALSASGGSTNSVDYFQYINADRLVLATGGQITFPDGSVQNTASANYTATNNAGISISNDYKLATVYNSNISNTVSSVVVGGAPAAAASEWKSKTIVQVLDTILFPDLNPDYVIPTLTVTEYAVGVAEVGSTITRTLVATGTKNDAGLFQSFVFRRNGVSVKTTYDPTGSSSGVASLANQFGYTNPNNPNTKYTDSYTENYVATTPSIINWSVSGNYAAGLPKYTNKGALDTRTSQSLLTNAPQLGGTLIANSSSLSIMYPYFWGTESSSITADGIVTKIANNAATKVLQDSSGSIQITFNANVNYIWFAIPVNGVNGTIAQKINWAQDNNAINKGTISNDSAFIGIPTLKNVSSSLWLTVPYYIYISKGATSTEGSFTFS